MRALICDDEALVRSELSYALARIEPESEIVEVDNAVDALALLGRDHFDVLFLDVEMHGLNGLDAMRIISNAKSPVPVVFVSAHDQHAVSAFEHAAVDYLLKPVSEARLARTLERLHATTPKKLPETSIDRLPVLHGERTRLLRISEIRYVEADSRGARVVTNDENARFRGTFAECVHRLENHAFLRVHRAYLVNVAHITEITPSFGGTFVLRVDNRERSEVPVSRSYVRTVRERLGL